jgi:hypothetical protein
MGGRSYDSEGVTLGPLNLHDLALGLDGRLARRADAEPVRVNFTHIFEGNAVMAKESVVPGRVRKTSANRARASRHDRCAVRRLTAASGLGNPCA